jgi:hypothetical protein
MRTLTTTHNGQEITVELPEGYATPEEIQSQFVKKDFFESELQRRINSAKTNTETELMKNEQFISKVLTTKGIQLDPTTGKVKGSDIDIEKVKTQFFEENVKPLQGKLETIRRKALESEIISAAAQAGVKEEFLKPVVAGTKPVIVQMVENAFGYDDEREIWAIKEGESFKYSQSPTQQNPFAGSADLFKDLKNKPEFKGFFRETTQTGSGYNGSNNGSQTGQTIKRSQFEALTPKDQAQAIKQGVKVVD